MYFLKLVNIVKITKSDLIKIFTNYALIIVFIALSIIPSLYAWINIKASWDPYSEEATSRIKVAVVNNDKGTSFEDLNINMGQKITDKLKENTLLGWQFVDEDTSNKMLESGEIYASIIIPEDFSDKLLSFLSENIEKPEIIYKVNEKINAIAPKITSKGAGGVQESVNEEIIKTVSFTLLEVTKKTGIQAEKTVFPKLNEVSEKLHSVLSKYDEAESAADSADEKLQKIKDFLGNVDDNMDSVQDLLFKTHDILSNTGDNIGKLSDNLDDTKNSVKNDLNTLNNLNDSIIDSLDSLIDKGEDVSDLSKEISKNISSKIKVEIKMLTSLKKFFTSVNNIRESSVLNTIIKKLDQKLTSLNNAVDILNDISSSNSDMRALKNVKSIIQDTDDFIRYLNDNMDSKIYDEIKKSLQNAQNLSTSLADITDSAKKDLLEVQKMSGSADTILDFGQSGILKVKDILPDIKDKITSLSDKVDEVIQSRKLSDLLELIRDNVSERADFLSKPVDMKTETLYPIENYGSAMAPFYSVLASWVGLTLLVSIFKFDCIGEYSSAEVYFGRMALFLINAFFQGLIIAVGDLLFLRIYCLNPILFVCGLIFTSIVFTFIVYTLVSVFGNVGKVIAIILMILQVAGSGGTFPIQLTSKFFIAINPFLPFTYAISFLREAIGGIYFPALRKDIIVLIVFAVISIIIGIFLKKQVNKIMHKFTQKIEESGLM